MATYSAKDIRNVVLLGHGSSGKTTLSEALLFGSGAISRLGRIEDKNTVSDSDEEEQTRGFSVNNAVLPTQWNNTKVNIVDAPGYMDFLGEVKSAIGVADGAVLVVCAASGVEVGAEVQWGYLDERPEPRIVFINKMDRENASFPGTLENLNTKFDATFVPICIPIGEAAGFKGVVDIVEMKAYLGADGKATDIPAEAQDAADEARMAMMEYAAEVDDELMLKYLDGEELTDDEIRTALMTGSLEGRFVLVLAGSGLTNQGLIPLLNAMTNYLPSPVQAPRTVVNVATGEDVVLEASSSGPLVAQVFKTMADPFVGRLSYFRVYSGKLNGDSRVYNVNREEEERVGQVYSVRGREQKPIESVEAGDIGVVTKLSITTTNDTLCDRGQPYRVPAVEYPEPLFSVAIFPSTKADLDKLGSSLSRLVEEDPTLRVERNTETNETILSGMGESHIQIATRRLANKFSVQVDIDLPKIAYRETITKPASAQGRHKKQTGGRGQFGDVYCRFEPLDRGEGFVFDNEVFGGSVPRSFFPAVEKGIREIMTEGVLAGYPTVDFKCVLYDGSYHPVDSSEIAFKLAAHLSFRAAVPDAGPVLLEPVYRVVVTVPEEFMGDILGDLNTRRAQVQGMEQSRGSGIVTAEVPLAEIQRYATDLRSMTQGRGMYSMEFVRYDIVPAHLLDQIRADAQRRLEKEKERG
ncbi:MAG: elongation factor G [Chloroflexi bacterium]|nr:elongation factor G [Chloroflexota bacterium]